MGKILVLQNFRPHPDRRNPILHVFKAASLRYNYLTHNKQHIFRAHNLMFWHMHTPVKLSPWSSQWKDQLPQLSVSFVVPATCPFPSLSKSSLICFLSKWLVCIFWRFFWLLSLRTILRFICVLACIYGAFFWLLSHIPLHGYTTICLLIICWWWIWVVYSFGLLPIKLLWIFVYQYSLNKHILSLG